MPRWLMACLCCCCAEIKASVVCPATEAHVQKYQRKEIIMVEETEDDYKNITLPYITKKGLSVKVSFPHKPP